MSETDISQPETTIKRGSLPRPSERTWFLSGQTDTTEPTRQYEITGDEFVIGRGRDSDLHLPAGCISKKHAIINVEVDGTLVLRELGSTNGTFVNGKQVEGCLLYTSPSPRDRG